MISYMIFLICSDIINDVLYIYPDFIYDFTIDTADIELLLTLSYCCPNNPNPIESFNIKTDFDIQGNGLVWYASPQLFFNCTLCLTGAKGHNG
jgi:hypothetical protein